MSVKVIISDILKKRHDRVTALEVLRRDLGGLETAVENLLSIAGGGGRFPMILPQSLHPYPMI